MSHLVSIIIPAFNSEKYISETLESVFAQTYSNWEIILVDDGSTDGTLQIVNSYEDPRIKVLFQKNKGVKRLAETINYGLDKANGEFVTMLPSDDVWPSDRLISQLPLFSDPNVVLVHGAMKLINPSSEIIGSASVRKSNLRHNLDEFETFIELLGRNTIFQPTVLIRSKALKAIGGYKQCCYMYAEDYPTQLELSLTGRFVFLDKVLAFYRLHPEQMTNTHQKKMILSDRLFVKNFLIRKINLVQGVRGYDGRRVEDALDVRKSFDFYKLGKFYAAEQYQYKKAVSLLCYIPLSKKTIWLKGRLLFIIGFIFFKNKFWTQKC